MSAITLFSDWFSALHGASDYTKARGRFVETQATFGNRIAIIQQQGGRRPVYPVQFPQIRLTLLGRRDTPADMLGVEQFAESVFQEALSTGATDQCIIHLTPLGSIMGPFFTAENRVIYALNFELVR